MTTQRRARVKKPISERIAEIGDSIPDEELRRWPADGAANFDHYMDRVAKPR
jgi:hypothetical protein